MTKSYDLVVAGGGLSGGLPAAALQRSGLDVLVLEANSELASFSCTHETWGADPGSPHVGVSFARNSPVTENLELEEYGFRFRRGAARYGPRRAYGHRRRTGAAGRSREV